MATNQINQVDVLTVLNNLMGRRQLAAGEDADLKRYCQSGFDYAWRYFPWSFALKTATLTADVDGIVYMPEDFDLDGYRKFSGATESTLEESIASTSGTSFSLLFDHDALRYYASPAVASTVIYQMAPPTLSEDSYVPFPSAQTVALAAVIYAKHGENPAGADTDTEWDMVHAELDRLAGRAFNARPRTVARNRHDVSGTYTGFTG